MQNSPETTRDWKIALRLLRQIAVLPEDAAARVGQLNEAHDFFAGSGVERLQKLARLVVPGITDKQLLCVLVPVERVAARERITDADMGITSHDSYAVGPATFPLIVVADNIRSAVNIGGLFRTVEFLGAEALWLCGYSATPEHPHVARSAMGAEKMVPWRWFDNVREALIELRENGVHLYALETTEWARDVTACAYEFPAALIVGNERFGLDPEIVDGVDATVIIQARGIKNSLNVVSALAIAGHVVRGEYDKNEL